MAISTLEAQGQLSNANPNIISDTYTGNNATVSAPMTAPPPIVSEEPSAENPAEMPNIGGMPEANQVAQDMSSELYGRGFVGGQESQRNAMMAELADYDRMLGEVYQGKSFFPTVPGYVDNPADLTSGLASMASATGANTARTAASIDTAERAYQTAIGTVLDKFNQFAALQLDRERQAQEGSGGLDINAVIQALTGGSEQPAQPTATPTTEAYTPMSTTEGAIGSSMGTSSLTAMNQPSPTQPPVSQDISGAYNRLMASATPFSPSTPTTPPVAQPVVKETLPALIASLPSSSQYTNPSAGAVTSTRTPQTGVTPQRLLLALRMAKNDSQVNTILKLAETVKAAQGSNTLTAEQQTSANQLRQDFEAERKIADTMVDAQRIITNSTPTRAGDMAAVTAFIRMLTKRSIVTGAQSAEAQETDGLLQEAQRQYQELSGGGSLLPAQREQLRNETNRIYQEQMGRFQNRVLWYASVAPQYGVDPYLVVGSKETLTPYFAVTGQAVPPIIPGGRPAPESFIKEKPSFWDTIKGGLSGGIS